MRSVPTTAVCHHFQFLVYNSSLRQNSCDKSQINVRQKRILNLELDSLKFWNPVVFKVYLAIPDFYELETF